MAMAGYLLHLAKQQTLFNVCGKLCFETTELGNDKGMSTHHCTAAHWYNASPRRGLALSMQIVNFLIEFLWALYCFLDFTERDLHW